MQVNTTITQQRLTSIYSERCQYNKEINKNSGEWTVKEKVCKTAGFSMSSDMSGLICGTTEHWGLGNVVSHHYHHM